MDLTRRALLGGLVGSAALAGVGMPAATAAPPVPVPQAGPIDAVRLARIRSLVPELWAPPSRPPTHSPAVVIGSGFGAAITALRLGQAGIATTMLERGLPWPIDPRREITTIDEAPDGRGFWQRTRGTNLTGLPVFPNRFNGVLDQTDYEHISVWRGAAVGGGSLVFTGVMIAPEERFFRRIFGSTLDHADMTRRWYPKVRAALRLSTMPEDVYRSRPFGHSRRWDADARRGGYAPQRVDGIWRWDTVRAELQGTSRASAIEGRSNLGNANGAKFDLRQNYLPQALATGRVGISHSHAVTAIGREPSGRYWIRYVETDPVGDAVRTGTMTADRLFLGAGSIGTSELLLRARDTGTLPALDERIGRGWGTNGDAAMVRSFGFSEGLTQAAPCASRIVDEQDAPVSLENWYVPGLPANVGVLGSLGMALTDARSTMAYDPATDRVDVRWPRDGNDEAIQALRRVQLRIAGGSWTVPSALPFARDVNASFTAHPLGGAVLGDATDGYGRIREYPGLYVTDGALMPGSAGTANPALTIAALAERNIATTVADRG